jgi:hypothetical protein
LMVWCAVRIKYGRWLPKQKKKVECILTIKGKEIKQCHYL